VKTLRQYPRVLLNVLVLHETFRRLDFRAEDLYVEPSLNEHNEAALFVLVKAQGKEFRAIAGPLGDLPFDDVSDLWIELATRFNQSAFPEVEEEALYREFWATHGGEPELLLALVTRGFRLPRGAGATLLN